MTYGWVPEWPKGADCKSVSNAFGGSNPPPSTCKDRKKTFGPYIIVKRDAAVAELADAQDLKSCGTYTPVPVRFRFAALETEEELVERISSFFVFRFQYIANKDSGVS